MLLGAYSIVATVDFISKIKIAKHFSSVQIMLNIKK